MIAGLTESRHSDGGVINEITGKKVVDKINCGYYQKMMKRIIGYMVTWTTYGSWLQGDKRGLVLRSDPSSAVALLRRMDTSQSRICKKW
jgi:hypothetical protein